MSCAARWRFQVRDTLRVCNIILDDVIGNLMKDHYAKVWARDTVSPSGSAHITHRWSAAAAFAGDLQDNGSERGANAEMLMAMQFILNEGTLFPDVTEIHAPWPSRDPTWSDDDRAIGNGMPRRMNRPCVRGNLS